MQENDPLVFKYSELREKGGLKLSLALSPALFSDAFNTPETLKSLRTELSFSVVENDILLEGSAHAEMNLECARCAAPLTRPFSGSFDELYPDTVEYIDVRGLLRETVALLEPMKVLCSETCKGRCPVCGIDRNRRSCACVIGKNMPFGALKEFKVRKPEKR